MADAGARGFSPPVRWIDIDFTGALFGAAGTAWLGKALEAVAATEETATIVFRSNGDHSDYDAAWIRELRGLHHDELTLLIHQTLVSLAGLKRHSHRTAFLAEGSMIGSLCCLAAACGARLVSRQGAVIGCDEFRLGFFMPLGTAPRGQRITQLGPPEALVWDRAFLDTKKEPHDWVYTGLHGFEGRAAAGLIQEMRRQWEAQKPQQAGDSGLDEASRRPPDEGELREAVEQIALLSTGNDTPFRVYSRLIKARVTGRREGITQLALLLARQFKEERYQATLVEGLCHAFPRLPAPKTAPAAKVVAVDLSTPSFPFRFLKGALRSGICLVVLSGAEDDMLRTMNRLSFRLGEEMTKAAAQALWAQRLAFAVGNETSAAIPCLSVQPAGYLMLRWGKQALQFYPAGFAEDGRLVCEAGEAGLQAGDLPPEVSKIISVLISPLAAPDSPNVSVKDEKSHAPPAAGALVRLIRFLVVAEMHRLRLEHGVSVDEIMEAIRSHDPHAATDLDQQVFWNRVIVQFDHQTPPSPALAAFTDATGVRVQSPTEYRQMPDRPPRDQARRGRKSEWTATMVARHLKIFAFLCCSHFAKEWDPGPAELNRFFFWSTGFFDAACSPWGCKALGMQAQLLTHGNHFWPGLTQGVERRVTAWVNESVGHS